MKLIFGCGYLGERVAALWEQRGETVVAVTRSADRAKAWTAAGRSAIVADVTQADTLKRLPQADTVLWAVGFDRSTNAKMRDVYVSGLSNTLTTLAEHPPGRFVYVSSTSVYGHADGEVIDESSTCTPDRENGHVCLEAEALLQNGPLAEQTIILRLAGIYGPGRLPNLARLSAGEAIAAEPEHRLNLIHVDDAAAAVTVASTENVESPNLFVVADGQPVKRREFYQQAATLWQTLPPVFDPVLASRSRRGSTADKRIDNTKLRHNLLPTLLYPDFQSGLTGIHSAGEETGN
ncbi:MAG: NAD-dependent epimerase/dehydratase family protein [Pirellulales bacterium]|nr:NAD-dependent epimerase/dehydratase family protein [Pirellulales bacterium]